MVEGSKRVFTPPPKSRRENQKSKFLTTRPLLANLLLNNELQNLQAKNHRLSKKSKEIEEEISDLISNNKSLKQEKDIIKTETVDRSLLQSVNIRFEQMEMKLNQLAEMTENIFLQNVPLNDPMDVEPDVQPEKIIIKNQKNNVGIVEDSDISQDTVKALKEYKNLKEKTYEETLSNFTARKKGNYTGKILQLNKEAPYIQRAVNEFKKK